MNNIIAVVGPTASGKTALSIEFAKHLDGEIVSCDSMQIYKYMSIGTAKPSMEEQAGIPHHMIDIINPGENFSVADFVCVARKCIDDIINRGKLPVLVGGTGLYIDSIINNIQFSEADIDIEYRQYLWELAEKHGNEYVHNMLRHIDEPSFNRIHPNNVKRVIRALEVYKNTGVTITHHNELSTKKMPLYNAAMFGIEMERQVLYRRIDARVDKMMEDGLLDEVKIILSMGVDKNSTAMQAIGYKELAQYLNGLVGLDDAIENIKRESRRYAKRQLTWFRKNDKITWVMLRECYSNITKLLQFAKNVLHN